MSENRSLIIRALVVAAAAAVFAFTVSAQSGESTSFNGIRQGTEGRSFEVMCHATGSNKNPFVTVNVSDSGKSHVHHEGDIIPAPLSGCPSGDAESPTANPEPLTMLLFGVGLSGVAFAARRGNRKRAE